MDSKFAFYIYMYDYWFFLVGFNMVVWSCMSSFADRETRVWAETNELPWALFDI